MVNDAGICPGDAVFILNFKHRFTLANLQYYFTFIMKYDTVMKPYSIVDIIIENHHVTVNY